MKNILVTRATLPELDEYVEEIKELWESHWITNMGTKHEALREELKKYLKVNEIELFTNGHMALEMSLQAFDFPAGSEVITTPFTFASTIHAIVRNNLVPVFCDINDANYTLDTSKIEPLITDKTVAIMPVHVYGNICDYKTIDTIANKYNLKVIYDAAHTFGETIDGVGVGSLGDVSCFSFHATKVFNTIEGGAACFKDIDLKRKLYHLKNFGIAGLETVATVGANAKMNEFCAAMGLCNLRHVSEEISKRKAVYEAYIEGLKDVEGIKLNSIKSGVVSNYAYFPIVVDETKFGATRDDVFSCLAEVGIGARKYFYPIASEYDCYKDKYNSKDTPVAKYISDRVLTLPIYPDLEITVVEEICNTIKKMVS